MNAIRVWWIPQVPGKPFLFDVPSIDAGVVLCDALARYDLFQFENRIKPDYANAGGIEVRDSDGDWLSFDPDDEDDIAEARSVVAAASVEAAQS